MPPTIAGFVYMHPETGECTNNLSKLHGWVMDHVNPVVIGTWRYRWDDVLDEVVEVWD